jgi:hypothetical protein
MSSFRRGFARMHADEVMQSSSASRRVYENEKKNIRVNPRTSAAE